CAWRAFQGVSATTSTPPAEPLEIPDAMRAHRLPYIFWFALAACGSTLLLATTNQMCQEVAAIPLLWVLPLSLYLLSFILCFESDRIYSRAVFGPALAFSLGWAALVLYRGFSVPIRTQVAAYSAALFAGCMTCHGELARSRPAPERLTSFYLTIAAGGAAGGVFVAIPAPRPFAGFSEIHISLWMTAFLAAIALLRDAQSWLHRGRPWAALALLIAAGGLANFVRDPNFAASLREQAKSAWSQGLGPFLLPLAAVVLIIALWNLRRIWWSRERPFLISAWLLGTLGFLGYGLASDLRSFLASAVSLSRSFYRPLPA